MLETRGKLSRLLPYLRLCRAPNVFTAAADVTMGYIFVHRALEPTLPYLCLLAATCCLYSAGMVLNDLCDIHIDRAERPQRPLPSGQISLRAARRLVMGLLLAGMALAVAAGFLPPPGERYGLYSGGVALALIWAIVAYDVWLKKTPLFAPAMGLCRFLNVLLGMSAATAESGLAGWQGQHYAVAAAIGVHIVGVTLFAREEARRSGRGLLVGGVLVMAAGWLLLATFPSFAPAGYVWRFSGDNRWYYYLLLMLLAFPLVRHCATAIANPQPHYVQRAVKQGIWVLIWMDAAVAFAVAPPIWSLLIVAFLPFMLLLGRRVYST
jgi:4-hydroxybenzoate polyprenyltransferase